MGKIKTKLIKRTANVLIDGGVEFNEKFEKNKRILGNEMPSKKVRNQLAGYIARLKRAEKEKKEKIEKEIASSSK